MFLFVCFAAVVVLFLVGLLGLLNWRSNPEALEQNLQRLMEVEGGEIVKVRPISAGAPVVKPASP